jgi:hypothetical protein
MRHDWRSNAKPPHLVRDKTLDLLEEALRDLNAMFCERCRAKVLDRLCESCFEIVMKELAAVGKDE